MLLLTAASVTQALEPDYDYANANQSRENDTKSVQWIHPPDAIPSYLTSVTAHIMSALASTHGTAAGIRAGSCHGCP